MMSGTPTQRIMALDRGLKLGRHLRFDWFDVTDVDRIDFPEGIESATGELLYALVAIARPRTILETGTRMGIASRYIALALGDHVEDGLLITLERCGYCFPIAAKKFREQGFDEIIWAKQFDSRAFDPSEAFPDGQTTIDMLYLDSEPQYRYEEFHRYLEYLSEGALIVIHDMVSLHCRQFHGVPEWLQPMIESREVSALSFPTDSGLTVMQYRRKDWEK